MQCAPVRQEAASRQTRAASRRLLHSRPLHRRRRLVPKAGFWLGAPPPVPVLLLAPPPPPLPPPFLALRCSDSISDLAALRARILPRPLPASPSPCAPFVRRRFSGCRWPRHRHQTIAQPPRPEPPPARIGGKRTRSRREASAATIAAARLGR